MNAHSRRTLASVLAAALLVVVVAGGCSDDTPSKTPDAGLDSGGDADSSSGPLPAHCNPLVPKYCALPWPSSFYLKEDSTTATGFRVNYSADALPIAVKGHKFDPTALNGWDGFSPAVQPLAFFEGGVSAEGLVGQDDDYAKSLEATALVQIIDYTSGERFPVWAEIDLNALEPGFKENYKPGLMIRPAKRLLENHRYVVVLRVGLKAQDGSVLAPPEPFRKIRDGETTGDPTIDNEGKRLEPVLKLVEGKGVARKDMLLVWDFHTASGDAIRGNVLFMLDDALKRMQQTGGPDFKVTSTRDKPDTGIYREVLGTISVPSYLASDDGASWLKRDASGKPEYRGQQDFEFRLHIPACAETAQKPLPVMIFGHGLFGAPKGEMLSSYHRGLIDRLCMVQIGVKWIGLSEDDRVDAVTMIVKDWAKFPRLTDRVHQAHVNFAALVELAVGSKLWAASELAVNGTPAADGKQIYYYGISNGGVNGFGFAALQTRIERFVVQVGGGPWTLLMQRSASFLPFIGLLRLEHPDPMNLALLVHLSQSYWDPIDPASYAGHIVDNPLPGRTVKKVIVQEALEDPLVNNVTTRYLVRTMEGKLPLLTPKQQSVYGVDEKAGPLDSAYAQWDTKSTWKHPGGNLTPKDAPPRDNSAHEILRRTESCTLQLERFFKPDGKVEHTCTGPCTNDNAVTP